MTKRFVNKGKDVFHYGEWWCSAGGEHCADVIATALNEIMDKNAQLKKENEQLKQENKLKGDFRGFIAKDIQKTKEENEQLKKGMIEVVDRYIRNVEHNPPSSTKTYLKVKVALDNVREGLRDLLEDLE